MIQQLKQERKTSTHFDTRRLLQERERDYVWPHPPNRIYVQRDLAYNLIINISKAHSRGRERERGFGSPPIQRVQRTLVSGYL